MTLEKPGAPPAAIGTSAVPGKWKLAIQLLSRSSPVLSLLLLIVLLALIAPEFFSWSNFVNISRQSAAMGILAIGQTLVIILAGIDLSVGSIMAFSGCLIAVAATQWGVHPYAAVLLGILGGVAIGVLNGAVIAKARIQDFIATLGSMTTVAGLALLVRDGLPISGIPDRILRLGSGKIFGIPVEFIVFLIMAVLGWIILNMTTLGRNALAIGGNLEAAKVSGIRVDRTRIIVYGFSGLCAAVASIVMIGRLNSANALMGSGMELLSIAAVVLGGTSLAGGAGGIGGTIIGVFTMGVLSNGLDLLNISAFWQRVILGLVIIGVVTLDTWRRRRTSRAL